MEPKDAKALLEAAKAEYLEKANKQNASFMEFQAESAKRAEAVSHLKDAIDPFRGEREALEKNFKEALSSKEYDAILADIGDRERAAKEAHAKAGDEYKVWHEKTLADWNKGQEDMRVLEGHMRVFTRMMDRAAGKPTKPGAVKAR